MSEQELWDKFYEHAWAAAVSGGNGACDLENEIFCYIFFGELFELAPEGIVNEEFQHPTIYTQTRKMVVPDWGFLIVECPYVWETFKEMYPESAAIEVLYV